MSIESAAHLERRNAVEEFLYMEAELLDRWQLDEWLMLFTSDARYVVPSTDLPSGDPQRHLAIIDDDIERLSARVQRLKSRRAHREFPHSRTHRVVSNVRVEGGPNAFGARSSLVMYRYRSEEVAVYVARAFHELVEKDSCEYRIRYRRMELEMETLKPHGAVSTIL